MVIIITGSGERTAESYNGSSTGAPLLHVVYDPTGGAPPNALPTAGFTATPETGEAPLTVSFDAGASDDTDGTIVSYEWDYGDGTTGTGEMASRDYDAAGSYTVTLMVTDDLGATGSATYPLTFTGNQAPTASFTYATTSTDAPFTVDFDAGASDDIDRSIVSFDWDYGDSTTATLAVTTTGPIPNQTPTASFTATPGSGNVPLFVAFDASASSDSDGTIDVYDWEFDDGTTATGASVNHSFVNPGTYAVNLTITDNDGATDSATTFVAAGVAVPAIDVRVLSGSDDAEESQSGSVTLTSSDLELADETSASNPSQTIGMRFVGVDIPQGATIVDAHVQFQVDESDSGTMSLVIRGQAADDASAFSSSSATSRRGR